MSAPKKPDTEVPELRPCPFCGRQPRLIEDGPLHMTTIDCDCDCEPCVVQSSEKPLSKLAALWNRRDESQLSALQGEVERLRAELDVSRMHECEPACLLRRNPSHTDMMIPPEDVDRALGNPEELWLPKHWRTTLAENPTWIVGATKKPNGAQEEWERVEVLAPQQPSTGGPK